REALRLLNGEGLVHIEPNKGVRVRRFDRAFLENLFDIRLVIEEMQSRRAAKKRTSEQLEALHVARMEFEALAECQDTRKLLECNRRFHGVISEAAGNSEAEEIELRHWRLLPTLWEAFGYPRARIPIVIDDHRHIEAAIRERDSDGAAMLAAAHCFKAKRDMLEALERNQASASAVVDQGKHR
ncbi:MAG: GntR family transcriptional regulator, partial [Rhodospirillales bacterium]|nr:GntR family transcriptional regulator [Rhodospirillales bacterium]